WLEIQLEVQLGLALGHERIAKVVAEAALTIGRVDEAHEAVPPPRAPHHVEARVNELGPPQLGHVRHADALAVQECAAAATRGVQLAGDGLVDGTEKRKR